MLARLGLGLAAALLGAVVVGAVAWSSGTPAAAQVPPETSTPVPTTIPVATSTPSSTATPAPTTTPAAGVPARISVSVAPNAISCGVSSVSAFVVDANGAPVPNGTPVTFVTNLGIVAGASFTGNGVASTVITMPVGVTGSAFVTASAGSVSGSAIVPFLSCTPPAQVPVLPVVPQQPAQPQPATPQQQTPAGPATSGPQAGQGGSDPTTPSVTTTQPQQRAPGIVIAPPNTGDGGLLP